MKKLAFIIFTLLTIGALAPMAQAQWGQFHPYWGYYPYYWSPYYGWPVVVYDPVRTRQLEIVENLEKLNKASDKLLAVLNTPTEKKTKEAGELADKIAKYSRQLQKTLSESDVPKAEPNFVGGSNSLEQVRQSAETINALVDEVNRTDINLEVVNMAKIQQTLNQLREIEAYARGIKAAVEHRG